MAPEVITGSHDGIRYGAAADVWSLGMVLWETCTMALPWEQHHNKKFILNELLKAIEAGDRPEVRGGCWYKWTLCVCGAGLSGLCVFVGGRLRFQHCLCPTSLADFCPPPPRAFAPPARLCQPNPRFYGIGPGGGVGGV